MEPTMVSQKMPASRSSISGTASQRLVTMASIFRSRAEYPWTELPGTASDRTTSSANPSAAIIGRARMSSRICAGLSSEVSRSMAAARDSPAASSD